MNNLNNCNKHIYFALIIILIIILFFNFFHKNNLINSEQFGLLLSLNATQPMVTTNGPPIKMPNTVNKVTGFQYNESKLAHKLLDGLRGIEIGASMHNPFGLDAWNIDYTDDPASMFQQNQIKTSGAAAKVHIISPGDKLPFTNNTLDFVINSHVLEHFYDPIKAIEEWLRIVRPGGYVYMDIPHKERTFDKPRNRTTLAELLQRHTGGPVDPAKALGNQHHSVWITEDLLELCRHFNWTVAEWRDVDEKLGIGFTIVLKKSFVIQRFRKPNMMKLIYNSERMLGFAFQQHFLIIGFFIGSSESTDEQHQHPPPNVTTPENTTQQTLVDSSTAAEIIHFKRLKKDGEKVEHHDTEHATATNNNDTAKIEFTADCNIQSGKCHECNYDSEGHLRECKEIPMEQGWLFSKDDNHNNGHPRHGNNNHRGDNVKLIAAIILMFVQIQPRFL